VGQHPPGDRVDHLQGHDRAPVFPSWHRLPDEQLAETAAGKLISTPAKLHPELSANEAAQNALR
jgi:hypothetical protein